MPSPEKRDLDLTRERLCAWLAGKLPDARDLRVIVLGGPSATGFSSDTLLFDADWADGTGYHHERLVVRFKPKGFVVFPSYDVGMQYRVMKILGDRTDVPVPRMRWHEPDERPLGAPFYIMDRVDGRVPTDMPPYHMAGWVTEISPEERGRMWWSGLEAMSRVHRLDWRALGFDFLAEPHRGATPLLQQLHYYDEFFSWGIERSRYPLIEAVQRWLHANQPREEPVALCWGDSRPGNQIFDDHFRCVAVIDWEMVRLGDPVQDLAWWITLDRCFSEGLNVERLPGFPDRAATIARWEELVGREAQHIRYYEMLGLYRFAIIMARVSLQMKYYEIFPPESDMDVNNLASATLAKMFEAVAG
jgi:aminoglycoside phosphotransferase (APT) family kinase protein